MKTLNTVYEFLYNASCCESAACTMSIHRTLKGAEMAMEFHKTEVKKEYDKMQRGYRSHFDFDFDQWWGIRETKLKD